MSRILVQRAFLPLLLLALVSCGGDGEGTGTTPPAQDSLDTAQARTDGGLMKVGGRLFAMPSPVQTALFIRKLGLPYQKGLPMAAMAGEQLTSKRQRALYMGICGADLAYVTIHKDGQRAMGLLKEVRAVSGALEIGNAFDQDLMERFGRAVSNEDSLLRLSGEAFRAADQYLKGNDRTDVSALVLAGGWVEGMYLTLAGAGDAPAPELAARVGEQKRTLDNLIALLEATDTEHSATALIAGLKEVAAAYAGVVPTYQFQQPTVDAAKRTTYINSVSSVTVPPATLKAISDKVNALRSTILA